MMITWKVKTLSILLVLTLLPFNLVHADDLSDSKNKLEYVKSQIQINQQLIEQINQQASSVQKEIQEIDTLVQYAQNDITLIEQRILNGENSINAIKKKREDTDGKMSYLNYDFNFLTKSFAGENSDYWQWALDTDSPTQLNLRLNSLISIYNIYDDVVSLNHDEAVNMKAEEGSLLIETTNLQNDKQILLERKKYVEDQLNYKQTILGQLSAQKDNAASDINDLEETSEEIQTAIEKAIREMQSHGYSNNNNTPIKEGKGVMLWPTVGGHYTSNFGYRIHPIKHVRKLHAGVDIGGQKVGTDVYAANDGIVLTSSWVSGYGYTVIIDHGDKISTLYGHNSKLTVKAGQEVKRGQKIAEVGSTGNSTGPHIHFEVRVNGVPEDPKKWL